MIVCETGDRIETASNSTVAGTVHPTPSKADIVGQFLQQVEEFERNIDNCTLGTQTNLGEGVVDQYGVGRFTGEALVAVNRANFLTRIWKYAEPEVLSSEQLLFSLVRSMVELDDNIFAAGNCHSHLAYKDYRLFCPFAHRQRNDSKMILVKDLSIQYDYLGNDSEWFWTLRQHASHLENFNKSKGKQITLHDIHCLCLFVALMCTCGT